MGKTCRKFECECNVGGIGDGQLSGSVWEALLYDATYDQSVKTSPGGIDKAAEIAGYGLIGG